MKNQFTYSTSISLNQKDFFNEIFSELYIPLVLFAQSFLENDKELAEDIVQDVFTNLLLKKTIFKSKISLKAYMYLSVKNSFLNFEKHKKVKQLYVEEKQRPSSFRNPPFVDKIIEEEVKFQLFKALNMLPERCKKVFELSLKGLRNNEIASEMKISIETVKSHKKKGKKLLKRVLNPIMYTVLCLFLFSIN